MLQLLDLSSCQLEMSYLASNDTHTFVNEFVASFSSKSILKLHKNLFYIMKLLKDEFNPLALHRVEFRARVLVGLRFSLGREAMSGEGQARVPGGKVVHQGGHRGGEASG